MAELFGKVDGICGGEDLAMWPAVAWTLTRGRDGQAYGLIAVSILAIAASGSFGAAIITICAMAVYLAARARPAGSATSRTTRRGATAPWRTTCASSG